MDTPRPRHVSVNADGVITIRDTCPNERAWSDEDHRGSLPRPHIAVGTWHTIDAGDDSPPAAREQITVSRSAFHDGMIRTVHEAHRQIAATSVEFLESGWGFLRNLKSIAPTLLRFLSQPVWVSGRHTPRRYARGTLFVLDVMRFGFTFGFLFLVLFMALNYQSFLVIAQSYIEPITELTSGTVISGSDPAFDARNILTSIPSSNRPRSPSALPSVGPPENMLIIPKLKLQAPIVLPPADALLREDWPALESEIQNALQQGVAHYPGTARPGQAGNFFLTGHSSYYAAGKYTSIFARLYQLEVGDQYIVYYNGDRHTYRIREKKKEILPSDVSIPDQPLGALRSTLMTCTPVGTTLRRLVVIAYEIDDVSGEIAIVGHRTRSPLPEIKTSTLPI